MRNSSSSTDGDLNSLLAELRQLRIREDLVLQRIESLSDQATADAPPRFQIGDRVRITNTVRRLATWTGVWNLSAVATYRRATVVSVVGDRVSLRTDNGIATWRLASHLQLL